MQIYSASQIIPITSPPIAGGAIAVSDGRIIAVGTVADLQYDFGSPVTEFPGCVIMPGLVNAHTHLELTHFPSWKVRKGLDYFPKSYVEWVQQVVKIRRSLTPEDLEHSVRYGMRLCMESGTTSVGEILTDYTLLPLYAACGLSGRVYLEGFGYDPTYCQELLKRMEDALQKDLGQMQRGLSPHTPHTVSGWLFRGMEELARRYGVPKAIHVSESPEEVRFMHDTTGDFAEKLFPMGRWEEYLPSPMRTTSTAYLDGLGVLDAKTIAIHAVHLTPADAAIIKERGVSVVLCPRSNECLSVGVAPHHLLKSLGIPLAIGTDSLASNDSLSLWDEMRYLQEIEPDEFTAKDLFEMATMGGARALGIADQVGSLEVGKRADFLVMCPQDGLEGALYQSVLESGKLEEVYIGGKALMQAEG